MSDPDRVEATGHIPTSVRQKGEEYKKTKAEAREAEARADLAEAQFAAFREWTPIGAECDTGTWSILFARFHDDAWEFRTDHIGTAHMGAINNARSVNDD